MKRFCTIFILVVAINFSLDAAIVPSLVKDSQPLSDSSKIWKPSLRWRKVITGGVSVTGLASTFFLLNDAWYKDYPRASLRSFDDSKEWLQLDKMGHAWTTYNSAYLIYKAWKWSGVGRKDAMLLGGLTSISYLAVIEYLDGRSAKWGWSWSDMAANVMGVTSFLAQELLLNDQKFRIKFTAHRDHYSRELVNRTNDLFGSSVLSRLLKDYNSQTYWLSISSTILGSNTFIPKWISVSIGAGAQGMLGGFSNRSYDDAGNLTFDRTDIRRFRQWYLSLDIDYSKIKTNSRFLRACFDVLNVIKIPFPAFEYSVGKFKGHWFYF